ncbi:hypothetical protein STENM327S_06945 [Streptomyces tendae]
MRCGYGCWDNVGRTGGCSPSGAVTGLNFEALDVVPVRPEGRGTVAEFERAADGAAKGWRCGVQRWGVQRCRGAGSTTGGDAAERR